MVFEGLDMFRMGFGFLFIALTIGTCMCNLDTIARVRGVTIHLVGCISTTFHMPPKSAVAK